MRNNMAIFYLLDIPMAKLHWLQLHPLQWQDFPIYTQICAFLGDIEVVNDVAECAVKYVCEYTHMTQAAGDRDNVVLFDLTHSGRISNLRKRNLNFVKYNINELYWSKIVMCW